jgi:hypothetical protein
MDPEVVIVPLGEEMIDAAQIGQINLLSQFLRDVQAFGGPNQGGRGQ